MERYFVVNKYLSLRLKEGKTFIYIKEKEFIQCRYLLLNIPFEQIDDIDTLYNIDNLSDEFSELEYHNSKYKIPPEIEFWGHCSNLQVWYEYDYDTRLLHSNLSFPLLKKLNEAGDPLAKKVFKDEIANRFEKGNAKVMAYLLEENLFIDFSQDEILILLENLDVEQIITQDPSLLFLLLNKINTKEKLYQSRIKWVKELRTVKEIRIENQRLSNLKGLEYFTNLEILNLNENQIEEIEGLDLLTKLKELNLNHNQIKDIRGLDNLLDLKELYLGMNQIENINGLENLNNLEIISLYGNKIKKIKGLDNLSNLKSISLSYNELIDAEGLHHLNNLEYLDLRGNQLKDVRDLISLTNSIELQLSDNHLKDLKGLEKLQNLEILYLQHNQLAEIKELEDLHNLKELWINDNNISEGDLERLKNMEFKIYW